LDLRGQRPRKSRCDRCGEVIRSRGNVRLVRGSPLTLGRRNCSMGRHSRGSCRVPAPARNCGCS